ncbi:MAG TPA: hypothetical protein VIF02_11300 [Methylocella sp.]
MTSLKQRFERFMLSTPGIESIDEILRQRAPIDLQRADYLACDRRAVIEVKSLDVNPDYKIQRFLDGLAQAGRLPCTGDTTLAELLCKLPDGQVLFDEARERVTKVLDDVVAKADDQTRDTKRIFNITDAVGIVVILNENATLLYPDISTVKLFDMLRKQRDGALRYVHNQVIVLISESHIIDVSEGVIMYNMATVYSEAGNDIPLATTFVEGLQRRWAAFNNAGYLESSDYWDKFRARDPVKPFNVVRSPPSGET